MIKKIFTITKEYILAVLFFGISLAGLAGYIFLPEHDFSQMENRYLANRPQISTSGLLNGTYMSDFETYTKEQLPLRDELVRLKALCEMALAKCENNDIVRGKNGFLFEKTLTTSSQLNKNISAIKEFIKNSDRDVFVAIAPTSDCIYNECVPYGMPVLNEELLQERLCSELGVYENSRVINLYDELEQHKDEQLYYRTDHHWTTKGAYYAYKTLGAQMGYDVVGYGDYGINSVDDFYGTYYAKYKGTGIEPDMIEYPCVEVDEYVYEDTVYDSLYDYDKLDEYDKYAFFMRGNPSCATIKSAQVHNGKSIVVIKNSYANCLLPYLSCSYEYITIIDLRYYGGSVSEVINESIDAAVLLLYDWSFMNSDNHFYKLIS